jgi:DMSO/TMAO reductase YedYZ molybdopterin-dependent catalytic subunit
MQNRRRTLGILAGVGGVALAGTAVKAAGLVPPDASGWFGVGAQLTYAGQRLLTGLGDAREFSRAQLSTKPYANGKPPKDPRYVAEVENGFSGWRLAIDGLVERPGSYSVADVRALPKRMQRTQLVCEEGWSYVAEWGGAPLSLLLERAGVSRRARYVVYRSIQKSRWDSIDLEEALHGQTLVAHEFNGGALPPEFGGPLRLRVPRQLGYKSIKYLTQVTVTDTLDGFGAGSGAANAGYQWYAGI